MGCRGDAPPPPPPATPRESRPAAQAGEVRRHARDGLDYVFIPPGSLEMGCAPGDAGCFPEEKPRHRVTLTRGFWLGKTLATAAAYSAFAVGTGRRLPQGTEYTDPHLSGQPAESLSWSDAVAFCTWTGGRLPTEAEWEHAARGGRDGQLYPWGDEYPWPEPGPEPIASANGFGLSQMVGIAGQWCSDRYGESSYGSSPVSDPAGPSAGTQRVLRGPSSGARHNAWILRTSHRERGLPDVGYADAGVRCALDSTP